jgi:hypothetical protein
MQLPSTIQARSLANITTDNNYDSGYELSGGRYIPIAVPFAGALATFPYGINNSGEIVGGWWDSNKDEHGFTLIGDAYTSFDCPASDRIMVGTFSQRLACVAS